MFCFNCGYNCGTNPFKFCPSCGTSLEILLSANQPSDSSIATEEELSAGAEGFDFSNIFYEDFDLFDDAEFSFDFDSGEDEAADDSESSDSSQDLSDEAPSIAKIGPSKLTFNIFFTEKKKNYSGYNPETGTMEISVSEDDPETIDPKTRLFNVYDILDEYGSTPVPVEELCDITAYHVAYSGFYYAKQSGGLFFMDTQGSVSEIDGDVTDVLDMAYDENTKTLSLTVVSSISHQGRETREECNGWYENTYDIYYIRTQSKTIPNIEP